MTLRVLVVESNPEEILFLQDVLSDLDGSREWTQWTHVEPLFATSWAEAEKLLAVERLDVIVLDMDLCDVQGQETFRRCHSVAPELPPRTRSFLPPTNSLGMGCNEAICSGGLT